ncbi:MAG TPA: hypothetical protein VMR45_04645 [Patescibacteria group bacterium]|nr:hypothetical protein [Patescibacteria group bacterium]
MSEILFDVQTGQTLELQGPDTIIDNIPPSAVSLSGLLHARQFDVGYGTYTLLEANNWTPDKYLEFGKWVLRAIEINGEPQPLTEIHLERLRLLGLSPPVKHFGKINHYKQRIGAPLAGDRTRLRAKFRDTTTLELIDQAAELAKALGRKPKRADYVEASQAGNVPTYQEILRLVGSVNELNDLIGYPDYATWEPEDFINFGTQFAAVNEPGFFIPLGFDLIGKKGRGPWARSTSLRFGTWLDYRQSVTDKINEEKQVRDGKLELYKTMINDGRLPQCFGEPAKDLYAIAARYNVIQDCAPDMSDYYKLDLAQRGSSVLIRRLTKYNPELTPGYVEMVALSHNLFDDIWPEPPKDYLRLSPEEVTEAKAEQQRRRRLARKAASTT